MPVWPTAAGKGSSGASAQKGTAGPTPPSGAPGEPTTPNGDPAPCDCPEARKWRAYWTTEAIAARLHDEVDLYRRICHERWSSAMRDARGAVRAQGTSFAELERRRKQR